MAVTLKHELKIECDFCHITTLLTRWNGDEKAPGHWASFVGSNKQSDIPVVDMPTGWARVTIKFADNGEEIVYASCGMCIPEAKERL